MWDYALITLRTTVLGGLGDRTRERFFRMNITACLHRGLTPRDLRRLPDWWHQAASVNLAGGPIEVIWSRGLPDTPSAQPCANPRKQMISSTRPDLWIPQDCGACPSCVARRAYEQEPGCALPVPTR